MYLARAIFSIVWSYGTVLKDSERAPFNEFIHATVKAIFPEEEGAKGPFKH